MSSTWAHLEVVLFHPVHPRFYNEERAAILLRDPLSPTLWSVRIVEDPGAGHQNIIDNRIDMKTKFSLAIIRSVRIPTTGSFGTIRRILEDLPKVNVNINPGGMFPWTFGNYVRRFLQELDRQSLLNIGPQYADEFYDLNLQQHLGRGVW